MSSDSVLSGSTLGRYRLGPLLGRGGMGDVYRADDLELRRPVAIKVLPASFTTDPDRLGRFVQEARTASALNHPHLVAIYEVGEAQLAASPHPVHFIAMELVQGETLRQALDSRRLDLKRTLEYLAQAADALAAAHNAGIIHRDLKPENLMIAQGGYTKVLDFGLAKLRAHSGPAAGDEPTMAGGQTLPAGGTSPGVVMGTVGYMSPEQAQGLPVDHRSDIFSFGCILYEAATSTRPFVGTSAVDTLHKIIHVQPPPVGQLAPTAPYELQRIIRKCLSKSPDERYQTMKDVALDLRELRREVESGSSPAAAAPPESAAPGLPRRWPLAAAMILAAVAVAVAVSWLTRSDGSSTDPRAGLSLGRITASGLVIDAVISPDGNYLAFVESEGGVQKLQLRQFKGVRPLELLSRTGGFWGIEFSRDSSSIYFAIKSPEEPLGALYSIPLLGGTPRALLNGIDSKVTFSPDGSKIAFLRVEPDGTGASSLVIAGADGGNPRPLVTLRPPEFVAPGFFTAPSWSPDGQRIAATIRNSASREARLALFDVNTGERQPFPHAYAEATAVSWLPDGSALVLIGRSSGMFTTGNGGQLWLQPYPSGEVRRITADMLEYRTASITSDGTALVSVAFEASARLSLLPMSGGDEQRLPEDRYAGGTGVTWTPDGQRLLYAKNVRGDLQIWTMTADGGDRREIVTSIQPAGVVVSPDGRSLVYAAERENKGAIWRANLDGTNPRRLADVVDARWLAISPDGRHVYFASSRDGSPATYRVPMDAGEVSLVAPRLERAVPSPDGRLLAGVYRDSPRSPLSIGVLDAVDARVIYVVPNFAVASGSSVISWTPDGTTLLYTTAERTNIWKQAIGSTSSEKVTEFDDQAILRFALSPDGRTLLLCRGTMMRDAVLLTNFR